MKRNNSVISFITQCYLCYFSFMYSLHFSTSFNTTKSKYRKKDKNKLKNNNKSKLMFVFSYFFLIGYWRVQRLKLDKPLIRFICLFFAVHHVYDILIGLTANNHKSVYSKTTHLFNSSSSVCLNQLHFYHAIAWCFCFCFAIL